MWIIKTVFKNNKNHINHDWVFIKNYLDISDPNVIFVSYTGRKYVCKKCDLEVSIMIKNRKILKKFNNMKYNEFNCDKRLMNSVLE